MKIDLRILNGNTRDSSDTLRAEVLPEELGEVRLSGPATVELGIERAQREILLSGRVFGKQWLTDCRTLEEYEHSFDVPLLVRVVLDPHVASSVFDDGDEEEFLLTVNPQEGEIDLTECVRQQILLNEPLRPVKDPDAEFKWVEAEEKPGEKIDPRWGKLQRLKERMSSPKAEEQEL